MTATKVSELQVSVIMPCNDAARFIELAIRSVLAQTHQRLRLIVIDDGSRDESVKIVQRLVGEDSRVSLICLPENSGGPARPRNIGLEAVKAQSQASDYIAFLDADDIWRENKLSLQLEIMLDRGLSFSSTLHRHFQLEHSLSETPVLSSKEVSLIDHDMILRKNRIVTSGVLVEVSLLEYIRFNEESKFVAIEDYLAWLELHQRSICSGIIQNPLVFYRTRADSISSSKVAMAYKIYALLSVYQINGTKLGVKRFFYFATYLFGGVNAVILAWFRRVR